MTVITPDLPDGALLEICDKIVHRIDELGLERYDPVDILSHPLYQRVPTGSISRYFGILWRLPAVVFPITWRRLLGIEKKLNPAALYHLGVAYLCMEKVRPDWTLQRSEAMCEQALKIRLPGEHLCWTYPYWEHNVKRWLVPERLGLYPPSCGHYVSRLGRLFVEVGKVHNVLRYVDYGVSAANALLRYHQWQEHADGSCTVSYYPVTGDETINIGADVAALLATIPLEQRTPEMQQRIEGLTRMVLNEQKAQGEWNYCTKRHFERWGGVRAVDNHHTGMILAALAIISDQGNLPIELNEKVQQALRRGFEFYMTKMFSNDGAAFHILGWPDEADIVGYCEAVHAIYEIWTRKVDFPADLRQTMTTMLPKILFQAIQHYYDAKTSDVGSKRRWGRLYQVQSIRWGAGPLLQAIAQVLALRRLAH